MPTRKNLDLEHVISWQKKIIRHDQWVIRTAKVHNPKVVKWHRSQLRWVQRELSQSLRVLRQRHLQSSSSSSISSFPPHHNLWTCISKYEGGVHSIGPGHYGMLQMHENWGYGTSYHASDDSQSVQEWAAERAYAASHYSQAFLWGQWFDWDNAEYECLRLA